MNRLTRSNGKKCVLPQGALHENTGLVPEEIDALRADRYPEKVTCDFCTDKEHCPEYQSGAVCVNDRKEVFEHGEEK